MSKEYVITINGESVKVNRELYYAYMRPVWRLGKQRIVRKDREWSLESFEEAGGEIASEDRLVEEIVEDKILLEMLFAALDTLTREERDLVDAVFFQERTEREISRQTGVPRKTITYRRERILAKLRKFLGKS